MNNHTQDYDISMDHLKEISTWVSSVHDVDQLLELIVETGTRMMHAKASSLLLLDQKTKKLHFKVTTGEKKDVVKKFALKMGEGIAGFVAQKGEALLVPDVSQDSRWDSKISESISFETRSIACVPMKLKGKTIGAIEIINKSDGGPFQKEDIKLLTVFAEFAALAIGNARKVEHVRRENENLKEELGIGHRVVGNSKALMKAISDALKVANSNTSTLVLGESGTGKELLARIIHQASPRKDKHMIALNCAAMTESLLEDELFGHEKGAYTGAISRKIGKFELADESTIFLDEIGEMSPGMQAKLLRVLEEGVFYRVGGTSPVSVDVRVIAATNKNISEEVSNGSFREDLYYRLNVVTIRMPHLRERKEDIRLLVQHFVDIFKGERGLSQLSISSEAMEKMLQYDWPGNIRELRNVIERAVVMGNGQEILSEDLPIFDSESKDAGLQFGLSLKEAINGFKKEFITLNLKNTGGSRSKAASIMGIQRTYLSRLISQYKIKEI
jgi:Nif-specific regulatory protein